MISKMNRTPFLLLLVLATSTIVSSQPIKRYGAKIGVTSATWNWKTDGSTVRGIDNRLGLAIGVSVEWFHTSIFSLLTELHFVQKGMKENIPITTEQYPEGTGEFVKHNVRLDYLSFEVLPKFRFDADIAELYTIAGFRLDMSLSNSVTVEGREPLRTQSAQFYQSLVDRFKSPQFGGTIGVGVQSDSLFPLPMGMEFRYSPDFQSAYSESIWNIKNTSFEFLLTITK